MKKIIMMLLMATCVLSVDAKTEMTPELPAYNNVKDVPATFSSTQTVYYGNETISFYPNGTWAGSCNGQSVSGTYKIINPNKIYIYAPGVTTPIECWTHMGLVPNRGWQLRQLVYNGYRYNYKQ